MGSKTVTFRIDENLIDQFDTFASRVGADRTTLLTMFIANTVANRALPFLVAEPKEYRFDPPEPNYIEG